MNGKGVPLGVGFVRALVLYGVGFVGYFVGLAQFSAADETKGAS